MQRQLEPELMEDPAQVLAYAQADFEIPHNGFINHIKTLVGNTFNGVALDLGCGSGDICRRFAHAYPHSHIHAVDGSKAMLDYAESVEPSLPIQYIHGRLPDVILPQPNYDIIFSNSLLHHLPKPEILWQTVNCYAKKGTYIVMMDLFRPESAESARELVTRYAGNEPEILQHDFYHSLLAAFTKEEILAQLVIAQLPLQVTQISDRHLLMTGKIN